MIDPLALPFGDPRRLALMQRPGNFLPTRQDPAIVVCGGGEPLAEAALAESLCREAGLQPTIFVGNDQIATFPNVNHGCSLHPEKAVNWTSARLTAGLPRIEYLWAHRPAPGFNYWTRDWAGSTGLFCVKVARELGFAHVILCGVHMSPESNHFVRGVRWDACDGFKKAWVMRMPTLRPYVRSYGGWTRQEFGEPTKDWLLTQIEDKHKEPQPPTWGRGPTA